MPFLVIPAYAKIQSVPVIPAKAGIQTYKGHYPFDLLDPLAAAGPAIDPFPEF